MKKIILLIFFIASIYCYSVTAVFSANHYIRAGATGSADGSDWTNAWTTLVGITFVRGDTYYIAGGSYVGVNLDTANSGVLVITIKGSTVADHGTDTGWNAAYSVEFTPASFTSRFMILSSYWTFDGSVGSMTKTTTAYGFKFLDVGGTFANSAFSVGNAEGQSFTNITINHIYSTASTDDVGAQFFNCYNSIAAATNITISDSLFVGFSGVFVTGNNPAGDCSGAVFERNVVLNAASSDANHGATINSRCPMTNGVFRYNLFDGYSEPGAPAGASLTIGALQATSGMKIYGNVFYNLKVGNGIISGESGGATLSNALVYNNTFSKLTADSGKVLGLYASNCTAYNNLYYDINAASETGWTRDYEAFFNTTNTPEQANGQTGSGDPFINYSSGNYRLRINTNSGTDLGSPYNTDPDGRTRSTWTRGTYEFVYIGLSPGIISGGVLR